MARVQLKDLAFARGGDKGDVATVGIMALNHDYYVQLKRELTPVAIKAFFKDMVKGNVEVYPEDNIESFQIVLRGGLDGGATRTLRYDTTGKSLGCALLRMEVNIF